MNLTLHHPLNTTYCPRPPPFPTQSQKRYQIFCIKKEKFKANATSFSSEIVLSLHRSGLIFISPSFCTFIHNMFICPPRSRLCRPLGGLPYNSCDVGAGRSRFYPWWLYCSMCLSLSYQGFIFGWFELCQSFDFFFRQGVLFLCAEILCFWRFDKQVCLGSWLHRACSTSFSWVPAFLLLHCLEVLCLLQRAWQNAFQTMIHSLIL